MVGMNKIKKFKIDGVLSFQLASDIATMMKCSSSFFFLCIFFLETFLYIFLVK